MLVFGGNLAYTAATMKNNDTTTTVQELNDRFFAYSQARGWDAGYEPSFLAKSVIIEAAELLEHFQKSDGESAMRKMQDTESKREVAWEMVDVMYYLLMLARTLNIDITSVASDKLKELATRYPAKTVSKATK